MTSRARLPRAKSHAEKIETSIISEVDRGCVAVTDSGIGIPSDELDTIFDSFHRASNAAQARLAAPCGFGLGLFVARAMATQAGGELCVESELNRGSTFRLCLPLAEPTSVPAVLAAKNSRRVPSQQTTNGVAQAYAGGCCGSSSCGGLRRAEQTSNFRLVADT